jgi:hypothetical protein
MTNLSKPIVSVDQAALNIVNNQSEYSSDIGLVFNITLRLASNKEVKTLVIKTKLLTADQEIEMEANKFSQFSGVEKINALTRDTYRELSSISMVGSLSIFNFIKTSVKEYSINVNEHLIYTDLTFITNNKEITYLE